MMRNMAYSHTNAWGQAVFFPTPAGVRAIQQGNVQDVKCPTGETCASACKCEGVDANGVPGHGAKCWCITLQDPAANTTGHAPDHVRPLMRAPTPRERMMAGVIARKNPEPFVKSLGTTRFSPRMAFANPVRVMGAGAVQRGGSPPAIAYKHVGPVPGVSVPPGFSSVGVAGPQQASGSRDFTVLSANFGTRNPAPAGRRTAGGARRREPGASECGDTFADKITIRVRGQKATLRPVARPRDFGDGGPGSVGWGTNKENRLQAKLARKINKVTTRLGSVAGQITPSQHEAVAQALQEALDEIHAADAIHDKWVNRSGGAYPLAWSDDPAEYKGALDHEPFWDVYGVDQRAIVGCDPGSVQFRDQASPSYRIADRIYGSATVRADPQRLTGSVRGQVYFPGSKYSDGSWRMRPGMHTYDLVRCPSTIELVQRPKDRSRIWDHYMNAAKKVRCAQYRLWSAILNQRASNPGPRSGLDPVDPFDEIEIVTETVDPFEAKPGTSLMRAGQWTAKAIGNLRRMANPVEALGTAVAHGARKIKGIW